MYAYFEKAASGANILTITTGHVLDVIEAVLGPVTDVDARIETLWPEVEIAGTGVEVRPRGAGPCRAHRKDNPRVGLMVWSPLAGG